MKRIVALILALVMTMALVACGGDKPTSSTPSRVKVNVIRGFMLLYSSSALNLGREVTKRNTTPTQRDMTP